AEALYLTQSAVSFRIRQLENQLGVNLFTRHRNNIRLTTAGEKSFLKHFKQKKLDSAVIVYGVIAIYLIPYKFPLKSYLVAFLFV
ncbi:LysR family transcriptional regulator, partial [Salmonella enterica subsp. enterica serovar Kentucky]|nr:LysR family transcriptional regulator [Salmonella enterica subsp. enterica serovar Kentucky]